VAIKLNVVRESVRGKRLVVVDDSIVRGTTCRARLAMLREAGARELHMRVSAPPIRYPCFYGIDFPHADELIAARHPVSEIAEYLGVDSLAYQSVEGLLEAVGGAESHYCTACFTGRYPVPIHESIDRLAFERAT